MDVIDRKILSELQHDARMTNAALAARVGLSESACLRRVRLLEDSGAIEGYAARVAPRAVGLTVRVLVHIALKSQTERDLAAFERAAQAVPEIIECYLTTGESDYVLIVLARDSDDLERLHSRVLTKLPNVARVQSSLVLRHVVRGVGLPLGVAARA
jgi:DNA-binding Lrp family transcriptional regulator